LHGVCAVLVYHHNNVQAAASSSRSKGKKDKKGQDYQPAVNESHRNELWQKMAVG